MVVVLVVRRWCMGHNGYKVDSVRGWSRAQVYVCSQCQMPINCFKSRGYYAHVCSWVPAAGSKRDKEQSKQRDQRFTFVSKALVLSVAPPPQYKATTAHQF